jgi:hypothetical protein
MFTHNEATGTYTRVPSGSGDADAAAGTHDVLMRRTLEGTSPTQRDRVDRRLDRNVSEDAAVGAGIAWIDGESPIRVRESRCREVSLTRTHATLSQEQIPQIGKDRPN